MMLNFAIFRKLKFTMKRSDIISLKVIEINERKVFPFFLISNCTLFFDVFVPEMIKAIKDIKAPKCADIGLNCVFDGCDGLFKAKIVRGKLMGRRNTKHTPECELKARKVERSNAGTEHGPSGPMDDGDGDAINDAELVKAECLAIDTVGDDVATSKNDGSSECIIA